MDRIKELISKMTLEEKASLCSGADNWHTKEIKRLNIPSVMMVDGPHGLRKQEGETDHLGLNESVKAVCFPAACATASSFDVDLMERMGETLGAECQAENVSMLLGPAVNIKRSPLCGRNFEYLSEDPYLAGRMASAYIRGVQSQGVGTSIKHFALNNQETLRMTISSEVSERALREIDLPAFEEAVKESAPRTVMCSYNKINGEYALNIYSHTISTEINISPIVNNKIYKKEFLITNNLLFDENLRYQEDDVFTFEVFVKSHNVIFIKDCFYHYNQRCNSLIHNVSSLSIEGFVNAYKSLKNNLESQNLFNKYKTAFYLKFKSSLLGVIKRTIDYSDNQLERNKLLVLLFELISKNFDFKELLSFFDLNYIRSFL